MLNLRKFNNYDYSDAHIDHIIHQFETNALTPEETQKYLNFDVVNHKLVYIPNQLECVKTTEVQGKISEMYNDFALGLGVGIKSLYNKLNSRYLGINRKDVENFLQLQTPYQLNKTITKKITNKPLLAKYPNHLWSCDLIDMTGYEGQNKKKKFILTVIDHFSKYVFADALVNKKPQSIINGFESIFNNQSYIYPSKLVSDNGGEFVNALFTEFCETNNIIHVTTMSHSPKQNALIENFNGKLRKLMADVFVRTNSTNWIDHLKDMLSSRNSTVHSITKKAPANIWKPEREPILNVQDQAVKDRLNTKARNDITKTRSIVLAVNDRVRILLSALHTEVRKEIKSGNQKKIVVKYSPNIYIVKKVIIPTGDKRDFQQIRYILRDDDDYEVWDDNDKPIKFYGSDLQKITGHSGEIITQQDAHNLNKTNIIAP
jgi:transposase InsO family protein